MKRLATLGLLLAVLVAPSAAHAKLQNLILEFGQDVLIAGKDDIGVRAQCVQNDGGSGFDFLRVYVATANDAVMDGAFHSYPGNGTYLTSMTPLTSSLLSYWYTNTGVEGFYAQFDAGYALNLTTMHGYVVNIESVMMGLNANGNDCVLSINVQEVKKFKETF